MPGQDQQLPQCVQIHAAIVLWHFQILVRGVDSYDVDAVFGRGVVSVSALSSSCVRQRLGTLKC